MFTAVAPALKPLEVKSNMIIQGLGRITGYPGKNI